MPRLPLTLLTVACALATAPLRAGVRIDAPDHCAPLRLEADGAPLSSVLRALSERQGFALAYEAGVDPLVDTVLTLPEAELVQRLTRTVSAAITTEPDPDCAGVPRIAKIWVMPRGGERPPQPVPTYAPSAADREALRRYRRAHGLDDEGRPLPPGSR